MLKYLDTSTMDTFLNNRQKWISEYDSIVSEYDKIVSELHRNWHGHGGDAFSSDAKKIRTNICGIEEILQSMCDMLKDFRDLYAEADRELKSANLEAISQ